jgi:hypothetical protein
MLYGQTNEKDSWGAEFPLAEPSISFQLREVRLAEKFVPVPTWEVTSLIKTWHPSDGDITRHWTFATISMSARM